MKADTIILEEIAQLLGRSASRLDEVENQVKFIRSEMVDDVEFMMFDQVGSIMESTQLALTKIERAYSICDSLASILKSLPDQYLELERTVSNKISNLMMLLEQIKISSTVLDSPNFVFVDTPNSNNGHNVDELIESIHLSNISLSTSVIQGQLKITRIEEINE
jgi:hypothetical protein